MSVILYSDMQLKRMGINNPKKLRECVESIEILGRKLNRMGLIFYGASGDLQLRLDAKLDDHRACVARFTGMYGDGGDGGDENADNDEFFSIINALEGDDR